MSQTKLLAAKELIQEKHYAEARAILRTVDTPTAKAWLNKLNGIAPERKQLRFLKAVLLSLVFFLGGMVFSFALMQLSSRQPTSVFVTPTPEPLGVAQVSTTEATESPQVTPTAADDLSATQLAFVRINLYATLATFCESVSDKSKGACGRWADTVLESKIIEVAYCDSEYDWITDRGSFNLCLLTQGISVLGDEPLVTPFAPSSMSESDIRVTGALIAYCDDEHLEDYCEIWAIHTYMNQGDAVRACYQGNSVLSFFDCLKATNIAP